MAMIEQTRTREELLEELLAMLEIVKEGDKRKDAERAAKRRDQFFSPSPSALRNSNGKHG